MGNSRKPGPEASTGVNFVCPARTPGSVGKNDQADADAVAFLGDTPGPLGVADYGEQVAVKRALERASARLQRLSEGAGDVKYDEYSAIVDKMPSGLTAEQYLAEMATDLNKAVNDWWFDAMNEFKRLQKGHPPKIGDLYTIDIKGPDDGSVVLVDKTPSRFIFQTIATSFWKDGTHPEYGLREFGFRKGAAGSVTFYTRGVSRPGSWIIGVAGKFPQMISWTRLMKGISNEIDRRGGKSRANSFKEWTQACPP